MKKFNEETIAGFRLSPQQARLWLLQQDGGAAPYFAQCLVLLEGQLNAPRLTAALELAVRRQEILRTDFCCLPAMALPLQVVAEQGQVTVRDCGRQTQAVLWAEGAQTPFDFARGTPLQAALTQAAPERHLLLLRLPALCADAAGLNNLVRELSLCYAALAGRGELLGAPLQYADLAEWQNELLEPAGPETGREYWREQTPAESLALRLPFERRVDARGFTPRTLAVGLEAELAVQLEMLARRQETTPAVCLLACWQTLLWRLTGQAEQVTGVAYDGRNYEELQTALGLFERYLPLGCRLDGDCTFAEVVRQLTEAARAAEMWQECFTWEQGEGDVPFFPFCFEYAEPSASYEAGAVKFSIIQRYACTERFKLKLMAQRSSAGLQLAFHYDAQLFRPDDLARLAGPLLALLRGAVAHPEAPLKDLPLLNAVERAQLLRQPEPPLYWPPSEPVHQLIAAQAARQPEAPAVIVEEQSLSYGELNRRANQLAHHLQGLGVGPETLVGLCLERSVNLIVGMLGILKAGGAYLPLEPGWPAERIAGVLAAAQPLLVLTQERLEADAALIARAPEDDPVSSATPDNLAYVLFTSGSTGKPKGVAIEHRQLHSYVQAVSERLQLPAGASAATVTTFAADLGHTAIFPALCSGGCLHVVRQERAADTAALAEYFQREQVDCLKIVPSHLSALLTTAQGGRVLPRRRLVLGGEAASWELIARVRELQPECRILNHYGPTETTVGVLTSEIENTAPEHPTASVPLGRPLTGVQAYVLDERLEPAPVWAAGEIYIGGAQVGRGYLNAPEQTAARFVPDPFGSQPGARLYRTGDLGRCLPDGQIEFLGRADQQVKIRGYRIELGEIETVLREHPAVRESVVVARESAGGEKRLVAYVVTQAEANELRGYLAGRLPDYMVPGVVVKLERLPLTANGKLDRAALPEPESELHGAYVAPRTQVEELLAGLWAEVLGVERVGVHDDFFELGGHSLLVTRLASRVAEAFQVELPFQVFFEQRTVAGLAERLTAARRGGQGLQAPPLLPVARDGALPLSFAQQRLWFFDQLEPNSTAYNIPGAVRLTGQLDAAALERCFNELVRRHEVLRTSFPTVNRAPVQVIAEAEPMTLPVLDLCNWPPEVRESRVRQLLAEEAVRPFRLERGPLLRAGLLRLQETEHILFFTLHHLISDAWSMGVLMREVAALYAQPVALPELRIQYADFAAWQRAWLQGEALEKLVAYWKQRLAGLPPALPLPTDRPRPALQTLRGERHFLKLAQPLTEALKTLSRQSGATLFMTLLAAFKVLLRHYTAQDDLVVGTNAANRNHRETENLIGFFINQLVLRTDLSGDPSFRELLGRVRETALAAYAQQELPFEKLVEELQPRRDASRSLLFQVKFELQEGLTRTIELPGLTLTPLESEHKVVRHDWHLSLWEQEQKLAGAWQYNADLFKAETIARCADDFASLLALIAAQPDARLSELAAQLNAKKEQELAGASRELLRTRRRRSALHS